LNAVRSHVVNESFKVTFFGEKPSAILSADGWMNVTEKCHAQCHSVMTLTMLIVSLLSRLQSAFAAQAESYWRRHHYITSAMSRSSFLYAAVTH
jgi:hypothetical protein